MVPASIQVPPLQSLMASSKQATSHPVQLPLVGGLTAKDACALAVTGDSQAVPETPPQGTALWPQQKEMSPLKSPVEQIMEEHSYIGSQGPSMVHPDQSPWQPQHHLTSSPQQTGDSVLQNPHLKGPNV